MNEFRTYLTDKKINWKSFSDGDPDLFAEFEIIFNQVSPRSFTDQKLYLINNIRRKYPLDETIKDEPTKVKKQAKPKIIPRIKK